MLINKSFETTRHALSTIGAVPVADSYPTEWTMSANSMPSALRKAPGKFSEIEYTVGTKPVSGLVTAWNAQRGKLGELLSMTEINTKTDPKQLAIQLGTIAGTLAALSYSLSEVAGSPDWLDQLTKDN
jgi:hypothetical protein